MPVQIFCVGPKIFLHIVPVTNILFQTKWWFAFNKIGFCAGTKVFEEALNAVKFLGWLKKFGLAQNILRPVKGQGIRQVIRNALNKYLCKLCTHPWPVLRDHPFKTSANFHDFDPYPPTIGIPAKCLWREFSTLMYCDFLTIGTNFDLRYQIEPNPGNIFMAVFIDLWPCLFTTELC